MPNPGAMSRRNTVRAEVVSPRRTFESQFVQPARPERDARFAVMPPDVADELAEVAAERIDAGGFGADGRRYAYRLTVRRMREVMNTTYHDLPVIRRRRPYNPAWIRRATSLV
ncbi:MAG: hypothetical protein QOE54_4602 [Streptosporangiaceae bacterium]|nr:nitrate reductase [Streptosporangiaceae bacterium]MDX6432236.1 hypothetical protein [Streptosporangiaceae bacterium]